MSSSVLPRNPADILIVDDIPANLQLLVNLLSAKGYRTRPVTNGEAAFRAIAVQAPDLVLLDINMPGMNGFEVCQRLKQEPETEDIPVIFISAVTEVNEKVNAFALGGVDYVTKPFQVEEILARVGTHLALRRSRQELEMSFVRLRDLEDLRDSLTHMIAHDMRSPLLAVNLSLELLTDVIHEQDSGGRKIISDARSCVKTLVGMVTQMLEVSRLEHGRLPLTLTEFDLVKLGRSIIELYQAGHENTFELISDESVKVVADGELLRRVLDNLVMNAVKYSPKQSRVSVSIKGDETSVRIEVADQGPGISVENRAKLFNKFGQLEALGARQGFGLGLAFVKLAVEAHGGRVGVDSQAGQGSAFWISLPRIAL